MDTSAHACSYSETLARYCRGLRLESVPREVKRKAMLCILDSMGCMIAGSASSVGRIVSAHVLKRGGTGVCTLFGSHSLVDVESAALANATLGHVLELDDGHRPSDNHLGCVVVSAAIAAAQHGGATGAQLLQAVIAGYDVMGRVGHAVCQPRRQSPFHGTSVTAGFGSAAVAGALWGLSEQQFTNALGIAGTGAGGTREVQVSGADCKSFQVGRASANGITAALLAQAGLDGPREIFEGKYGFLKCMTTLPRPDLLVSDLGTRFAVMECAFKIHSVCGILFTAIDAALALKEEHPLDPAHIDKIRVGLPNWVRDDVVFARRRPATAGLARFSVPFAVAAALKEGEVTPRQISDQGISDAAIAAIEAKIEVVADPKVDAVYDATKDDEFFFYPASVAVSARGQEYYRLESSPRGYDLRRALSAEEVTAKFVGNASGVVGAAAAQEMAELMLDLEHLDNLDTLKTLGAP